MCGGACSNGPGKAGGDSRFGGPRGQCCLVRTDTAHLAQRKTLNLRGLTQGRGLPCGTRRRHQRRPTGFIHRAPALHRRAALYAPAHASIALLFVFLLTRHKVSHSFPWGVIDCRYIASLRRCVVSLPGPDIHVIDLATVQACSVPYTTRSSPHIALFWRTTGRGDQVDRPRGRHHHVPPPA